MEKFTAKREYGKIFNGTHIDGQWVVRDEDGNCVSFSPYRNDLRVKYENIEFLEND